LTGDFNSDEALELQLKCSNHFAMSTTRDVKGKKVNIITTSPKLGFQMSVLEMFVYNDAKLNDNKKTIKYILPYLMGKTNQLPKQKHIQLPRTFFTENIFTED
jgi:hypothetical protein